MKQLRRVKIDRCTLKCQNILYFKLSCSCFLSITRMKNIGQESGKVALLPMFLQFNFFGDSESIQEAIH